MISKRGYQQLASDVRLDANRAEAELVEALREGQVRPEDYSIRHLAESLVEDGREWVEAMDPRFGGRVHQMQEAAGATSLVNFSNITGQVFFSRVMESYQDEDFVFTNIVPTVNTDLSGERIPGVQRLGDRAEVVGEGQEYPLVGVGEDWIQIPPTVKRGMISPVTKEALFYDRTNLVLMRAGEVGHFMGVNKEKRIINAFIDENETAYQYNWKGTAYSTYASSSGHGVVNLKATNGLTDWTNIDAALKVASEIVDPWTGEPIAFTGNDLVVCPQLVMTANRIVNATLVDLRSGGYATSGNLTGTTSPNPAAMNIPGYSPGMYKIRTSKLLAQKMGTKTSWFVGDIARTVNYYQNWGITLEQAGADSEKAFNRDIVVQFKVSEKGTPAVVSVRHMVKSTA